MTEPSRKPAAVHIARLETEMIEPTAPTTLPKAYKVGPYRITGIIGKGGMGVVYQAEVVESCSVPLGRQVALKMLSEKNLDDLDRRRFEREAAYLQALRHPGIVRILDLGEYQGRPFLVMQLVEGRSLDDVLRENRHHKEAPDWLEPSEICDIVVQALEALHVAHLAGILHRDLKPGNLMMTPRGGVKLLDFGMARSLSADHSRLTASGSVLGTPAYMPPEQAAGARELLGPRSDIYSMGAVCYELCTGEQPFSADTSLAVLRMILEQDLTPPSRHNPGLPHDLETIILKAMAKDPRDRYVSAEAMAEDLRLFRTGTRIQAKRIGPWKPFLRKIWSNRRVFASIALGLFLTTVLGVILARQVLHHMDDREEEIQEQVRSELSEMLTAKWIEAWEHPGLLDWVGLQQHIQPHPLDPALQVITLPSVRSNVRLSLDVAPRNDGMLELMISDRTLGDGYALRYELIDGTGRLVLLRGAPDEGDSQRTEVADHLMERQRPFRLAFERQDDLLTARVDDVEVIRFRDLAPIEGLDNDKVSIALRPDTLELANILLERQRPPERVSRLVAVDMVRQEGRYERALGMYREFLRDFPESEDAKAAQYRIGLCQSALHRYEEALETFLDLARKTEDDPRYSIAAIFHAWSNALKLGRDEEADRYFDTIRERFELRQLLAAIPKDTLRNLPQDYIVRAYEHRDENPQRALSLFQAAEEIATYLERWRLVPRALEGAGDVHLGQGRIAKAIEIYRQISGDERFDDRDRHKALLKIAEAERLRYRYGDAQTAYEMVIDLGRGEQAQWARLWLGDLLLYQGDRDAALRVWRSSREPSTRPGKLMAHLVGEVTPMATGKDRFFANDIEYFNAVLALLAGDELLYRSRLETVIDMGPPHDWPIPLARQIIDELNRYEHHELPDNADDDTAPPE